MSQFNYEHSPVFHKDELALLIEEELSPNLHPTFHNNFVFINFPSTALVEFVFEIRASPTGASAIRRSSFQNGSQLT